MSRKLTPFKNNRLISLALSPLIAAPYSIVASSLVGAPFLSLVMINTVTIFLIFKAIEIIKTPSLRLIFVVVATLKLFLVLINAQFKTVPFTGTDWTSYDSMARRAIEASGTIVDLYNNSFDLFVFLVACIYSVFGENINQIFFYLIPFSFLTFRYVYKTVMLITKSERRASIAGLLVLAWPANIVFSISVLRESFIQLLTAMSFYHFTRYVKNKSGLLKSYLFGFFASLTHSGLVTVPLAYTYVLLQRQKNKPYNMLNVRSIMTTGLVALVLTLTPFWGSIGKQLSGIQSATDITNTLETKSAALGNASTNYINSVPEDIGSLLLSLPYRLVMFTLSPFLWQISDIGTAIAFVIDAIPTFMLAVSFIFIFRNRRKFNKIGQNIIVTAAVCTILTLSVFSIGTNNYGTAMRHRTKILPILLVTVASFGSMYERRLSVNKSLVSRARDKKEAN